MQYVSTGINWRKNVKREPKRTRIIAVHFELLVRGAGVKQGPLISTAVHCLRVSSIQRDQESCLRPSRQIVFYYNL